MTAICRICHQTVHWRNQRGSLMPQVCACGGELVLATWTPEGYKIAERKPQPKRNGSHCVLCGRRGMVPGKLRVLKVPETFRVQIRPEGSLLAQPNQDRILAPDSVVCRSHESREERSGRGLDGEPYPVVLLENEVRSA